MNDIESGRHLLFASTGGHLAQLVKWSKVLGSDDESLWITFDNAQSRSLLHGKNCLLVPYIPPRGILQAGKALIEIQNRIDWRTERFCAAISTGAGLAVPGLAIARLHGVPSYYIESVSRVDGPSLSGRILSAHPGIQMSCQHQSWAGPRWNYRGTVLEQYLRVEKAEVKSPRIFVTLGTIHPYRFDRLIDAVLGTGLADERTIWQVGSTERSDLPGEVHSQMESSEFDTAARTADLVVTHAGVGTILKLLDMGIYPVVVPRRKSYREHVDDHQLQIASVVSKQGIGSVASPDSISSTLLSESTGYSIQDERPADVPRYGHE
ncbi:glycosyltransferase [Rhodococcus sp. SJ-2]